MIVKDFYQLIDIAKNGEKRRVSVAAAGDAHTLEAISRAYNEGIVDYILVGDAVEINRIAGKLGFEVDQSKIIAAEDDEAAASMAVNLVRENRADFLMKGKLLTSTIMKAVINKQTGLACGKIMSHVAVLDIPHYHKLLAATDGGIVPYPDLDAKKQITNNAVDLFHKLGYEKPQVGAVCAVEVLNPKLKENVEAAELKRMALEGEIPGCIIEGPISMDLATDMASVKAKQYQSEMAGDVDILLMHEMATCNIMIKSIVYLGGASMAGCCMGAICPIAMPSRGSSYEDKYYSLLLGKIASDDRREKVNA